MSFVAGDTGSKLRVTCRDDADSSAIDLTGSTVELQWVGLSGALVTRVMTIVDAANGIAEYRFQADELYSGRMSFEVKITDAGGFELKNLTLIQEVVRPELG